MRICGAIAVTHKLCTLAVPFACVRACETVSVVLVETGDSPRALTGHSGWRRLSFEKGIDDSKFEQQHVPSSACDTV